MLNALLLNPDNFAALKCRWRLHWKAESRPSSKLVSATSKLGDLGLP